MSDGATATDPLAAFKQQQRDGWARFAPLEAGTTVAAARLVRHARVAANDRVLDVACGTGVVALTAARLGARVTGLDLTPELLERAREHSSIANVDIAWHEGDAESLPFDDASFDVVVSQFGHIFAPRADVVTREMLRVLRPGGTLAFGTWPPELYVGRSFQLVAAYLPAPPTEVALPAMTPPWAWGDPAFVRERLGDRVRDVAFDRGTILAPALTPAHVRLVMERAAGPMIRIVQALESSDPPRLAQFRAAMNALIAEYWADNQVRQDFLLTRATKR